MPRLALLPVLLAVLLSVSGPAAAQEVLLPGVYVSELSVQLPGGETARGTVRFVSPGAAAATTLAPHARGRVPAAASIEVGPGVLQRVLVRAHEQQLRFRASFSGRDADGRYLVTSVTHTYIPSIRPADGGGAVLDLAAGGSAAPAITCSADDCTGPADAFLFLYHCVVNGHAYVPARGGGREAICTLRR